MPIMQRTHGGNTCCTLVLLQFAWIFYQFHVVSVALVGGLVKLGQIKIYYKLIIAYLDIWFQLMAKTLHQHQPAQPQQYPYLKFVDILNSLHQDQIVLGLRRY